MSDMQDAEDAFYRRINEYIGSPSVIGTEGWHFDLDEHERALMDALLFRVRTSNSVGADAVTAEMLLRESFDALMAAPVLGRTDDYSMPEVRDALGALVIDRSDDPEDWLRALVLLGTIERGDFLCAQALMDKTFGPDFQYALLQLGTVGHYVLCLNLEPIDDDVLDVLVDEMPVDAAMRRGLPAAQATSLLELADALEEDGRDILAPLIFAQGLRALDEDQCVQAWDMLADTPGFDYGAAGRLLKPLGPAKTMLPIEVLDDMLDNYVGMDMFTDLQLLLGDAHCDRLGIAADDGPARAWLVMGWGGGLEGLRELTPETVGAVLAQMPHQGRAS